MSIANALKITRTCTCWQGSWGTQEDSSSPEIFLETILMQSKYLAKLRLICKRPVNPDPCWRMVVCQNLSKYTKILDWLSVTWFFRAAGLLSSHWSLA